MKSLIVLCLSCLLLASAIISADTTETDYKAWKKWALDQFDAGKGQMYHIVLKDGRDFNASKNDDGDYVIDLGFGSFTATEDEVAKSKKTESVNALFHDSVNSISNFRNTENILEMRQDFSTQPRMLEAINWWVLYLTPDDTAMQANLKLLTPCPHCKGAGKIAKKPEKHQYVHTYEQPDTHGPAGSRVVTTTVIENTRCRPCYGRGLISCKKCNGSGRIPCRVCNGSGSKTRTSSSTRVDDHGDISTIQNTHNIQCSRCGGRRNSACRSCQETGKVKCKLCEGTGKKREYEPCTACNGSRTKNCPPAEIKFPFPVENTFSGEKQTNIVIEQVTMTSDELKEKITQLKDMFDAGIMEQEEYNFAAKKFKLMLLYKEDFLSWDEYKAKMTALLSGQTTAPKANPLVLSIEAKNKINSLKELVKDKILNNIEYQQKVRQIPEVDEYLKALTKAVDINKITFQDYNQRRMSIIRADLKLVE